MQDESQVRERSAPGGETDAKGVEKCGLSAESPLHFKAGRELDAQIAKEVMGWVSRGEHPLLGVMVYATGTSDTLLPHFSTDMDSAWSVVEKMRERNAAFVLGSNGCSSQVSAWFIDGTWALGYQQNRVPEHGDPHLLGAATAETAPLAICLAALKAIEAKEPTA